MRPRGLSRVVLVLVLVGASSCLGLGAPAALADAPVDRGWWTLTNPGPPAPAQAPPDVPADGLLVQGGPTAPVALAGLIFEPAAGATAQRLVLNVVSSSATTPGAVLELCPLSVPALNAEQGGPIADAPAYDCARKVTAAPGADGSSYTFDLRSLASTGPLAVAVLPTAPTDRVVLSKPGADSLVTSTPPVMFSPEPFPSEPAASAPAEGPVAQAPSLGTTELPPITPSVPAAAEAPTVAPTPTPAPGLASVIPTTAAAAVTGRDHHGAVGAGLLALLAAGCGLWAFAGRGPGLDGAEPIA